MRNLVQFIIRNVHWLLFFLLLSVSVFFLVKNNQFQRSKFLVVAQEASGQLHKITNEAESYLSLKKENEELNIRIAKLEALKQLYAEKLNLIGEELPDSLFFSDFSSGDYRYIPAQVIYNSSSKLDNNIQLNKGANDGVRVDMGVLSSTGSIIGVVTQVTPNFSLVIPILNSKFRPSCKIKNNNYSGPLTWDGKDTRYSYLQELPRHVEFQVGDTIVTSGYSSTFPEGIPVGIIMDSKKQENDNYTSLKIDLFTDFNSLSKVIIVDYKYGDERKSLNQ